MFDDCDFSEFEKTEPRQDSSGEKVLAELFKLDRTTSRMADEDAVDEQGRLYQIKASTKSGISTVRSFGPKTIEKLRRAYLIVAWGRNYVNRFEVDRTFFLSRCHIDPWLEEKHEYFVKLEKEADEVIETCRLGGFDDERLLRLKKRLHNGMLINDPNIPKSYIVQWGIEIQRDHPEMLRELAQQYPLEYQVDPPCYEQIFS